MKKLLVLPVLFLFAFSWAALPDQPQFNAMKDEMARTRAKLKLDGSARPSFIIYKTIESRQSSFLASLGALVETDTDASAPRLETLVYFPVGNDKLNSSGFFNRSLYEGPLGEAFVPMSYDGVRASLWALSDYHYIAQLDTLAKKQAFIRQKQLAENLPDFSPAPKGEYVEEVSFAPVDRARFERLVQTLSALGTDYPHVQKLVASAVVQQQIERYLNSEGSFYQLKRTPVTVTVSAQLQNKDGYKTAPKAEWVFASQELPSDEELVGRTREFLQGVEAAYNAKKADPYLGPVLLTQPAAAEFLDVLFVRNARFSKPLLMEGGVDTSAGGFKESVGLRVISHLFDVTDNPLQSHLDGLPLLGFRPVDDEGVPARQITLVKNGKLAELPTTRSLIKGQKESNGHARIGVGLQPRATLSNVFFQPKQSLPPEQLEQTLLDYCRELDLEYCYIVNALNVSVSGRESAGVSATRVYVKDGRKEPVYGLKLKNLTPRALRDIMAAGNDSRPVHQVDGYGVPQTLVSPSLLVEELELVPNGVQPDKKPFVSQPR